MDIVIQDGGYFSPWFSQMTKSGLLYKWWEIVEENKIIEQIETNSPVIDLQQLWYSFTLFTVTTKLAYKDFRAEFINGFDSIYAEKEWRKVDAMSEAIFIFLCQLMNPSYQ
jgi:hypothetical protein